MEKKQTSSGIKHKVVTWGLTFLSLFGGAKLSAQELPKIGTEARREVYKPGEGDSRKLEDVKAKALNAYDKVARLDNLMNEKAEVAKDLDEQASNQQKADSTAQTTSLLDLRDLLIAQSEYAAISSAYNEALKTLNKLDVKVAIERLKSLIKNAKEQLKKDRENLKKAEELDEKIQTIKSEIQQKENSKQGFNNELNNQLTEISRQNESEVGKSVEASAHNIKIYNEMVILKNKEETLEEKLKACGNPEELKKRIEDNEKKIELCRDTLAQIMKTKDLVPVQRQGEKAPEQGEIQQDEIQQKQSPVGSETPKQTNREPINNRKPINIIPTRHR